MNGWLLVYLTVFMNPSVRQIWRIISIDFHCFFLISPRARVLIRPDCGSKVIDQLLGSFKATLLVINRSHCFPRGHCFHQYQTPYLEQTECPPLALILLPANVPPTRLMCAATQQMYYGSHIQNSSGCAGPITAAEMGSCSNKATLCLPQQWPIFTASNVTQWTAS